MKSTHAKSLDDVYVALVANLAQHFAEQDGRTRPGESDIKRVLRLFDEVAEHVSLDDDEKAAITKR